MKILILGGHGFIGHNVAQKLVARGHDVAIVDCNHQYGEYPDWEYTPVLRQRIKHIGTYDARIGNVCDPDWMTAVFAQVAPDRVIDLATYPNAKMVQKNVVDATNNMITATAIALDLCIKHEIQRFVLASSSMVYGDFVTFNEPPNENAPCNPLTLYGSYKLQCERMCQIYHRHYGLGYCILRPSALYGPRDMIVRVISKMTVSALINGKILAIGPNDKLDFSNVNDVAEAFVIATLNSNAQNQIFNCTRGNGRRIMEVAEIIQQHIPCSIEIVPRDDFYPNRDALDSSRMIALTGWQPHIDIEQGIPEYLNWFVKQEFLSKL